MKQAALLRAIINQQETVGYKFKETWNSGDDLLKSKQLIYLNVLNAEADGGGTQCINMQCRILAR